MTYPTSPHRAPRADPAQPSPSSTPHDRWTKPKMADFLRALGATHSVSAAAEAVGMSRQSAYRLRARLKGEPFDIAWEAAFVHGYDALHQAALERALHGIPVPVYHQGELIGTRQHFDERLTCFLLGARNRNGAQRLGRYGAASEFWSERWDRLLARVEEGAVEWRHESDKFNAELGEEGDSSADQRDRSDAAALERRHLPDPLPKGREPQ